MNVASRTFVGIDPSLQSIDQEQHNMLELPLLYTENYTGGKRRRAQKAVGHHRNTLSAVVGQF